MEKIKWREGGTLEDTHVYQPEATSILTTVHHPHLQVIWTATLTLPLSHTLSISFNSKSHICSFSHSPDSRISNYEAISSVATSCSRVLGPLDYHVLPKNPQRCVGECVCVILRLTSKRRLDYTVNLLLIIAFAACHDSPSALSLQLFNALKISLMYSWSNPVNKIFHLHPVDFKPKQQIGYVRLRT